jgi:cardiolipin synthase
VTRVAARTNWLPGNDVRLLRGGGEFFPALCDAIGRAQRSVHIETYIYSHDASGECVVQSLQAAARRGVDVRVALDGFGSASTADELVRLLDEAGGRCNVYRPERGGRYRFALTRQRLRRLHRKTAVIDDAVAFIGGINILDDNTDPNHGHLEHPRFDFAVSITGPLVADVAHAQRRLWAKLEWARTRMRPASWAKAFGPMKRSTSTPPSGHMRAALITRDNLRNRQSIEQGYLDAIGRASRDIIIANAYFFPGHTFRKALRQAAARGVRVRLLLQGMVEYRLQHMASRSLYESLLKSGIEIYEYMPSILHAKVAVIDDYATVGSSNLDPFSLLLAREANVVVADKGFAAELRGELELAIKVGGKQMLAEDFGRLGWMSRLGHRIAYSLLRIAVALTGKGDNY